MRVISGIYGGRRLKSIDRPALRPTTDRVRESIFNILEARFDFDGVAALDLFAGTGALGIEAISRGAASCDFVESDRKTAAVVEANLKELGIDNTRVHLRDAIKFIAESNRSYDIVFADPPYAMTHFERLLHDIFSLGRIADGGLFVLEHSGTMRGPRADGVELLVERSFGDSAISIYRARSDERADDNQSESNG